MADFPFTTDFVLTIALAIVVIVTLAALFLPKFRVGEVPLARPEALRRLAYALRFARFRVAEAPDGLKVRAGSWTTVEVFARPRGEGTLLSYRVGSTTSAWTLIFLLVFLLGGPFLSALAIPLVVAVFLSARAFIRRRVVPLLSSLPTPRAASEADEIRSALVTGLSEGRRMAEEAYEAERSAYHDWLGSALLVSIVVWAVAFIGMLATASDPDFDRTVTVALQVATGGAVGAGLAIAYVVYRLFRSRLRDMREWALRLRTQLEVETEGVTPRAPESSAFELLAEASRRVPLWIRVRHDRYLQRDPGAAILVGIFASWAIALVVGGIIALLVSPMVGAALLALGVGLTVTAYLGLRGWRRSRDEEATRELDAWNRRIEGLRTRADTFLREL